MLVVDGLNSIGEEASASLTIMGVQHTIYNFLGGGEVNSNVLLASLNNML